MASPGARPPPLHNPLLVPGKISAVLDAFTLTRPALSLGETREATGMPASTVQRLVANLVSQGILDREGDAFRIGMKLACWAAAATRGVAMLGLFTPLLRDLRNRTGGTVCFFQAEQGHRVCVALAETRHALRREMHGEAILPLHAGSAGQVLLAWQPELLRKALEASWCPSPSTRSRAPRTWSWRCAAPGGTDSPSPPGSTTTGPPDCPRRSSAPPLPALLVTHLTATLLPTK